MQKNNRAAEKKYTFILVLSFVLPFIAWVAGMVLNPSGWMTDPFMFSMVPVIFVVWAAHFWYISLLVVGIIIALLFTFKKSALQIISISIFLISLVYSIVFFMMTKTAARDEFAA